MFVVYVGCVCFFFFKQKTAYDMRISDWSSDVCSSDLAKAIELYGSDAQKARWIPGLASGETIGAVAFASGPDPLPARPGVALEADKLDGRAAGVSGGLFADVAIEIGRAHV